MGEDAPDHLVLRQGFAQGVIDAFDQLARPSLVRIDPLELG